MHAQQRFCNAIHDCQEKDHLKTELSFFDLLEAMIQNGFDSFCINSKLHELAAFYTKLESYS